MDRVILHCDMNSFYASVELLDHPQLATKPVAVCGNPNSRHGIILAKNELAKRCGVVTAETIWQAKSKCPDLEFLKPHHDKYKYYSDKINAIYDTYTDMVEPFSIDESWLDVTGSINLFGSGKEIADSIRHQVKKQLGLTLSAGVSYNKIFAKMGSEYKKPDATTEITRENFRELLWPLPSRELFFVGSVTADKLKKVGILTIGDIAKANLDFLISLLGKSGRQLYDYANGFDTSPVCLSCERQKIKSVGNGITFRRNLETQEDIRTSVIALSDTVAGRLRKYNMKCQGVKVDIKDPFFKTISRQKQLFVPTNLADEILRTSLELINTSWPATNPIRMLTITGINLCDENTSEQLSLFSTASDQRNKSEKIERTMDAIRGRFGGSIINYGGLINNDLGINWDKIEDID